MSSKYQVRDEIEHLLDDNEDMAHLYLTRKWFQNQQSEALLAATASNSIVPVPSHLRRLSSNRSGSLVTSNFMDDNDVEDLEMLLEAYFMQLDGTRNKILSVSITQPQIDPTSSVSSGIVYTLLGIDQILSNFLIIVRNICFDGL